MERMDKSEAYITVKGYKEDFPQKPNFRLINPSKSELGKVGKRILDNISKHITEHTNVNQWKNSASVIEWFKGIKNKHQCTFIVFDIESFYPSISLDLFDKALKFAKEIVPIADNDLKIMMHSRKTLLFHENEPWIKRKGDENFDVPMGCLDRAEVCDLTGLYILSKIKSVFKDQKDNGLYRDDGLGILRNLSGPQIERVRKEIIKIFKECGLSITTKTNLKVVQFLDIELDLINDTYRPYRKPNDNPMYINVSSNHPPSIIKQIPESINRRLSSLSSSREVFLNNIQPYQEALKKSGFREELTYHGPKRSDESKNEKRKRK